MSSSSHWISCPTSFHDDVRPCRLHVRAYRTTALRLATAVRPAAGDDPRARILGRLKREVSRIQELVDAQLNGVA